MIAPFTPPHHDPPKRIFESSPAFSNYFSDDETSPPQASGLLRPSPSQSRLLGRLNAIGRQILRKDPGEHERTVLSAELDALEQTLNAPEPRSREPPDIADSGLFVDDEPEERPDKQLEETLTAAKAHVAAEKQKRDELTERVNKVVRQVQLRHEEIKHINDLVVARLDLSAQEILRLRSENHKMQAELHHSRSDFLFLKMQLRAVEVQAAPYLKTTAGDPLKENIERWKANWKAADMRLRSASHGDDEHTAAANGNITPVDLTDTSDLTRQSLGSTRLLKSRLTITRPGAAVTHHSADPFITQDTPPSNGAPERDSTAQNAGPKGDEDFFDEHEGLLDITQTSKTPWQELWDGLAEFAGIHDS